MCHDEVRLEIHRLGHAQCRVQVCSGTGMPETGRVDYANIGQGCPELEFLHQIQK